MAEAIGRMVFAPIEGTQEVWPVTTEVAKGTALAQGTKAGVALGNSGGHTFTKAIGSSGVSISGPDGAAGYAALEVGVFRTGTFEFTNIAGVDANTAQETPVYIEPDGDLTLTASTNVLFGYTNYPKGYVKAALTAPVKIGA